MSKLDDFNLDPAASKATDSMTEVLISHGLKYRRLEYGWRCTNHECTALFTELTEAAAHQAEQLIAAGHGKPTEALLTPEMRTAILEELIAKTESGLSLSERDTIVRWLRAVKEETQG